MTKDEQRAYNAAYYQKNKDRLLVAFREWKAKNRDAHRAGSAKWQAENPDKSNLLKAAYKKRYPAKTQDANKRKSPKSLAAHAARQRVRNKVAAKPDAAVLEIYGLSASPYKISCHWCGCETAQGGRHVDHVVPLCAGGEHTSKNLVIACKTCNLKKGRMLPEHFGRGEYHRR